MGIKILVVDDASAMLETMVDSLKSSDYQVAQANDGHSALHQFDNTAFDIVITDLKMPNMDGMELLKHIRINHPQTAVIIVTGYAEEYTLTDVLDAGAVDYLPKPFTQRELQAKLQRVVRERKTISELKKEIQERKQFEEKLQLQNQIVANMNEGILLVREDNGTIVFVNPRLENMFGYDPGEMIGRHVSTLNAPAGKHSEAKVREVMAILNKSGKWQGEIYNIKKDGTHFWCSANVTVIDHSKYGRISVSVQTDITDQKRVQEALKDINLQLEHQVQKRTIELQQKSHRLEETIIALKVLMKQGGKDRKEIEQKVLSNVNNLIIPYLMKLTDSSLSNKQKAYLDIVFSNLENIVSSFVPEATANNSRLTPAEIQVANFVKLGKTSKEISEILHLSLATVSAHRRNIRKKLGLIHQKKNLQSVLTSR